MSKKTQVTVTSHTRAFSIFALVTLVATLLPLAGFPQYVTGPMVNAILILTCLVLGFSKAALLSVITPFAALAQGIILGPFSLTLIPLIPAIALANVILVGMIAILSSKNYWLAVGVGALGKSTFLTLVALFINQWLYLPTPTLIAMSYPQLLTALSGGVIAYCIVKLYTSQPA